MATNCGWSLVTEVMAGRRVRITAGPPEGLEGIVIRKKNCLRFILSPDLIGRSTSLDVEAAALEPIPG
jgi:hypothetical protein